jgi:hypothetical protein
VIACLGVGSVMLHAVQGYFWQYSVDDQDCIVRQDLVGVFVIWSYVTEAAVFLIVPVFIFCLNILVIVSAKKVEANERLLNNSTNCANRRELKVTI